MKKLIPTIIIFLFCCIHVMATVMQSNVPSWVKEQHYTIDEKLLANSKDGFSYLLADYQTNLDQQVTYNKMVLKINNSQGVQNASEISVLFDPAYQTLTFHEITIIRNDKRINCLDLKKIKTVQRESDLERHSYDDRLTSFIILEGVEQGDIIEYSYSRKGFNPVYKNHFYDSYYLEYSVPVGLLHIAIDVNKNKKLNFKYYKKEILPVITEVGNNVHYDWSLKNIPATIFDEDVPAWYETGNGVDMTDFTSWKELREWAQSIFNEAIQEKFTDKKKLKEINENYTTTQDRILAALHFVQDKIRYFGFENGLNSMKPHNPNEIYKRRFGDCKDKSVLLCSILKELQVEAWPVLVNTNSGFALPNSLPMPGLFNHCIVALRFNSVVYYVDPTLSIQGGDLNDVYLPPYYNGLWLDAKSDKLIPIRFKKGGQTIIEYEFHMQDFKKPVTMEVTTRYIGSAANNFRYEQSSSSYNDFVQLYLKYYAKYYPDITMKDSIKIWEYSGTNEVRVTEYYFIDNFWQYSINDSNAISSSYNPFTICNALNLPASKKRTSPFALNFPVHISEKISVHLPEEWVITMQPEKINTDYLFYSANYSLSADKRTVIAEYQLQTLQDSVPLKDINTIVTHIETINKAGVALSYNTSLQNTKNTNSPRSIATWRFAIFLLILVIFSIIAYQFFSRYNPYSRSIYEEDEQPIGGAIVLLVISLIVRPFTVLLNLFNNNYFNSSLDNAVQFNANNAYYPIIYLEIIANTLVLVGSILSIVLLFKKRTSFPVVYSSLIAFVLIFNVTDAWLVKEFLDSSSTIFSNDTFNAFVPAIVWIPYLYLSDRSKNTFTKYHPSYIKEEIQKEEEATRLLENE